MSKNSIVLYIRHVYYENISLESLKELITLFHTYKDNIEYVAIEHGNVCVRFTDEKAYTEVVDILLENNYCMFTPMRAG